MKAMPAPKELQPDSFAFADEHKAEIERIIAKYPKGRQASAVMPLLQLAQSQHDNWLPRAAMDHVAELLDMPPIRVYEVATFYSQFNLAPVGKHLVQVCTTTPCWLRGSSDIMEAAKRKTGCAGTKDTSVDGNFTLMEVECLGACVNAPMVQINDDYYEDLTPERMEAILDALASGQEVARGSQAGRRDSMSDAGPTSLTDQARAAGFAVVEGGQS